MSQLQLALAWYSPSPLEKLSRLLVSTRGPWQWRAIAQMSESTWQGQARWRVRWGPIARAEKPAARGTGPSGQAWQPRLLPLVDAAEDVDLLCDERGGVTPARPRWPAHAAGDRPAQGVEVQHAHVVELALAGRATEDVHAIVHCGGGVSVAAGRQRSGSLQCAPGDPVRVELVHVVQEGVACSLAAEEVEVRAALGQCVPLARRRRGAEHAGLRPTEGVRRHSEDMHVAERLRLGIAPAEEEDLSSIRAIAW